MSRMSYALPPETLRALFADTLAQYWDPSAYEQVLERERGERSALRGLAAHLTGGGS